MTNNAILFLLLLMASCSIPNYLPTKDNLDINRFGSYISVNELDGSLVQGELIAIDSSAMTILTGNYDFQTSTKPSNSNGQVRKSDQVERVIQVVPLNNIKQFSLQYAKGENYTLAILSGLLLPVSHGFFLVASVPLNLITTIAVASSGDSAFKYNSTTISYTKLRMFARFPQGIPINVDLNKIR